MIAVAQSDIANPSAPSDCAAFKIRRLARRVTRIYDEALGPHGLTIGQFGILGELRRRRGIGIATLAERLAVDASTLSRLFRPLAASGLLTVLPDPDDRRAKQLWLTDDGAERVHAALPGWREAQARVTAHLGAARLAALRFTLDDAYQHLI
ncbi:MarR family winged helix-turn-helix transcriptional regulator [Sphingosinicellaceae bacterium]|nr:MarR family winged helix-turn-helix transcriptional regulator [Sphingosinicellaceae bacterium]